MTKRREIAWERGSDMEGMEARDNLGGAGDHVNGELFKELTINAGENEETDDISSSFKVRQREKGKV